MAFNIADILMQQGQAAAEARRQRGSMWGGLVQQAGQIPLQVAAERQAAQAAAQQAEIRQQQLEEGRRAQSAAIDAQDKQQIAAQIYSSSYDPATGKLDPIKVRDAVRRSGRPDMQPFFDEVIQKRLDADVAAHLQQLNVEKQQLEVNNLRNSKPPIIQRTPTNELWQGDRLLSPATPAEKPDTRSLQQRLNDADAQGDTEEYNRLLKVIKAGAESAHVTVNTGSAAAPAGDWNVQGEQFLDSIPIQWRSTVKKIAHYDEDPTKVASMRGGMRETLMQWVNQVNPSYDSTQYPTRQAMRRAFTSGPQSQTINSLNTAIGHLDQFTNVIAALDNGMFRQGNQAYNWLRTEFGDSAPTNFDGIRSILSGELAAAFKKSGATDQEIAHVQEAILSKNSAKQLNDYVKTIAMPALGSKVISFDQQYRQVMGQEDPFKILLPESETILKKYGIDPSHPQMGTGGGTPATLTPGLRWLETR
jgi:hypothetical protein